MEYNKELAEKIAKDGQKILSNLPILDGSTDPTKMELGELKDVLLQIKDNNDMMTILLKLLVELESGKVDEPEFGGEPIV